MKGNPRLRTLEATWVDHNGQPGVLLRDRVGISQAAAVVPQVLVPLLPLCDGTRDLRALRSGFELRTGVPISLSAVEHMMDQLDEALFLDSPRFKKACESALEDYRKAPFRPMALAGHVYPEDPESLEQTLTGYGTGLDEAPSDLKGIRGIVCPHIDYARGGPTYAGVWKQAALAAREADLAVIFGTDHSGGGPILNFTTQSYATPWGVLPTDVPVIRDMAAVMGPESAFSHELHHRSEHSIEAALVWLHYVRGQRPCAVVPILCGGVGQENGNGDQDERARLLDALEALRQATKGQHVLAVAAADLAHVGPAFGDPSPLGPQDQSVLESEDRDLLNIVCDGDADVFLRSDLAGGDRKVCGAPPVYALLHFLNGSRGRVTGYAQCPADAVGASFVSIAGVVLT